METRHNFNISVYDYKSFIFSYVSILILSFAISYLLTSQIWIKYPFEMHSFFELICVFIGLVIFSTIFITNKYKLNLSSIPILGIGFLTVATVDFFHILTYPFGYHPHDITLVFWLLARAIESIILFSATFKILNKKNTIKVLFITFYLPIFFLTIYLYQTKTFLIPLFNNNSLTGFKIFGEFILIIIYCATIYRILKFCSKDSILGQNNTLLALCLLATAEVSLCLYNKPLTIFSIFAHTLKVIAYFNLFKSVFKISVITPYNQLKQSQVELHEILDGLPLGLINYDYHHHIIFANNTILNSLNCSLEKIKGLTKDDLGKQCLITEINQDTTSDQTIHGNIRHYQTAKETVTLHTTFYKTHSGYIETFADAKVEQEVKNLKLQTQTLLNAISNHVIIFDEDEKIINYNNAAKDFFQITRDDFIGLSFQQLKDKLNFSTEKLQTNVLDTSNFINATVQITDDNTKHILFHYSEIPNLNQHIIGHIMVSTDITPIKINEDRLKQQEKMSIIGEMGSGIVHEAKNYLALINGYCDLLSLQLKNENTKSTVHKIRTAANDLNDVITDFLSLAKPSEIIMDIVSLNEIILSLDYIFSNTTFMSGTSITLDLMENDCDILGDESQIKQVILNLIKNAIEAMDTMEESTLKIITRVNQKLNCMEVIIEDNGKGISKEHLDKLGTPFFTTKSSGTGLGLSICYKMIADHGGQILVNSQLGIGTVFTIQLPIYQDENSCSSI